VGWAELVSRDAPEFVLEESDPRRRMEMFALLCPFHRQEWHECSEALIEPQIIPPFHGHQIAEPHVCQFMQISDGEAEEFGDGRYLPAIEIGLVVCYTTDILHSSEVMLGDKDLVILTEWIGFTEHFFVEPHTANSHVEH